MNENLNLVEILKDCPQGTKLGKLSIIREVDRVRHPNGKTSRCFECVCDCGNKVNVLLENLKSLHSTSCGHCGRQNKKIEIEFNDRFGKLTVIKEVEPQMGNKGRKMRMIECKCDCGNIVIVNLNRMLSGKTKSCGCLRIKSSIERFSKHKMANKHPLYGIWKQIKQRCTNKKHHAYKDYGGRNITICDEWICDFGAFFNWCLSNGWKQGLTIDRIDNNKGYFPSNCRFVDSFQQARNKRNNKEISFEGMVWHSLAQFCEDKQLDYKTVQQRLYRGNTLDKAIINAERKTI